MCTIDIQQIIKNRTYPDAGEVLYDVMVKTFNTGDILTINMEGVSALPSMFLNTSLGRYIEENGADAIKGKLSFKNITRSQVVRLQDYIKRMSNKSN